MKKYVLLIPIQTSGFRFAAHLIPRNSKVRHPDTSGPLVSSSALAGRLLNREDPEDSHAVSGNHLVTQRPKQTTIF